MRIRSFVKSLPVITDSDYTGPLYLCIRNDHTTEDFVLEKGKAYAQLIVSPYWYGHVSFGPTISNIRRRHSEESLLAAVDYEKESRSRSKIPRGAGGFGSTGL